MNVSAIFHKQTARSFAGELARYAVAMGWRVWEHVVLDETSIVICVRRPRVVWVIAKAQRGRRTAADSRTWHELDACNQEVYIWRPDQWLIVERILR